MKRWKIRNCNTILIENAKIAILSSGNIFKYKYRIGEEILLSGSSPIIQQVKFIYQLLGESVKSQTKVIKNQRDKQVEAIKEHEQQLVKSNTVIRKNDYYYSEKDSPSYLKQKEIFNELINERHNEILKQNN